MRADDARHGVRMAAAIEGDAGIVDVDARKRGRKAVGVAFATDLAVRDDVESGRFLSLDCKHCRIVLRLRQPLRRDAPEFARTHPRRKTTCEFFAVDQPVRLRITADERRG